MRCGLHIAAMLNYDAGLRLLLAVDGVDVNIQDRVLYILS
jgi:hypothetical protein